MLSTSLRRPLRAVALASTVVFAACDLPTQGGPVFQQTWLVPGDSVTVSVTNLLPADVRIDSAAAPLAFTLQSQPGATIATTLGDICGSACTSLDGQTAPKPEFTSPDGTLGATVAFPTGVNAFALSGGILNFDITNDLGFDPLRPAAGDGVAYGHMVVTIASGLLTHTDTIQGSATLGIPTGGTTSLFLLLPTGTYADSLTVSLTMYSPAGDPVAIDSTRTLAVAASLRTLEMTSASVVVANRAFSTDSSAFDLSDVEGAENVEQGGLRLTIINPFAATAMLNLVLAAPAQNGEGAVAVARSISVPAAQTSSVGITLTKNELSSLLGKTGVTISSSGTVSGAGAGSTVAVTPTQEIKIRTQLQLTFNVGG